MITDTAKIRFIPLLAMLALAPLAFIAQSQAASAALTSTVTLSDIDLSTPEGADIARNRLHQAARELCSQSVGGASANEADFIACMNDTVTNALRQIDQPARAAIESGAWKVLPTEASGVDLSTNDVASVVTVASMPRAELATPEGARIARERIRMMARHVCLELTSQHPSLNSDFGQCVEEATAAALRQVPGAAMVASQDERKPRLDIVSRVALK